MSVVKFKFVIIGGGISGLSTAYELSKIHKGEVLVLEREKTIGGLCRSLKSYGASYDLGSHRIHMGISKTALAVITDLCGPILVKNVRQGKLKIKKRFVAYPLVFYQFILSIGFLETFLCLCSYLKSAVTAFMGIDSAVGTSQPNYESHIVGKAGRRAYKLFYEPYARKVWGVPPHTISIDAVKKRVSMSNPLRLLREIFKRPPPEDGKNHYYYLAEGIGSLTEGLGSRIIENGGKLITNISSFEVDRSKGKNIIHYFENGERHSVEFEKLIATIPIDDLMQRLLPQQASLPRIALQWRALRLVYLHIVEQPMIEGETFYFPELTYVFGRVSIPARFSNKTQTDLYATCYTCEVPCSEGDRFWSMSDEEMYKLCINDLVKAGLISGKQKCISDKSFSANLKKVYPLYTVGWRKVLEGYFHQLAEQCPEVYASGRPGFFMHCNLDHSMEMGLELAKYILDHKTPKEWYSKLEFFHGMKLRD